MPLSFGMRRLALGLMVGLGMLQARPAGAQASLLGNQGHLPRPDPVALGRFWEGGPLSSRVLVAAPHEPFDRLSGRLAQAVAGELNAAWLVADGYLLEEGRLNVNRPTMGAGLTPGEEVESLSAQAVYLAYRRKVLAHPVALLVEIHGNSRAASAGQIEVAHRGLPLGALGALKAKVAEGLPSLPSGVPHLPLAVDGLELVHYRGEAAKRIGIFAEVPMAIQMEFPRALRTVDPNREAYAKLVGQSLKALVHQMQLAP